MIVAFKHKSNTVDLANKLIGYWTKSDWVHCEMLLYTPRQVAVSARISSDGITVSSWKETLIIPNSWDYYDVPVSDDQGVWDFLIAQADKSYNVKGMLASQIFGTSVHQAGSWFCSELTYAVLCHFSSLNLPIVEPANVNPGILRQFLINADCPKISINI